VTDGIEISTATFFGHDELEKNRPEQLRQRSTSKNDIAVLDMTSLVILGTQTDFTKGGFIPSPVLRSSEDLPLLYTGHQPDSIMCNNSDMHKDK